MVQGDKRKMTDKEKELQAEAIDYYRKQIADLEKENAELNDKLNNLSKVAEVRLANWQKYEKENAELKEEIKKWRDEWQEQVQKENDESYAKTLQTIQLTKAKDLIRNLLRVTYGEGWNYSLDVKVKVEDFLKEDNNEQVRT